MRIKVSHIVSIVFLVAVALKQYPYWPENVFEFSHEEQVDRFKEESLMMVMEVPDLDETFYTFESIHLHPKSAVWNQLAQNCGF